jgi:enamine deaminase RidA (YjgF/YER057c/UK114 family)
VSVSRDLIVPAHWRSFFEATGIPAAVRVGGQLAVSGHTGETADGFSSDAKVQFRTALELLTVTLTEAGMTWADVTEIQTFHVDLPAQAPWILEIAGEFMQPPLPAWTAVGIVGLFEPDALVEVSCRAHLGWA